MQKERFGIYPKEMRSVYDRDTCTPTSIAALCTIAKIRKRVSQQMNGERKCETHAYTMKFNSALEKRRNPAICNNVLTQLVLE